jgi:hypothetical protein
VIRELEHSEKSRTRLRIAGFDSCQNVSDERFEAFGRFGTESDLRGGRSGVLRESTNPGAAAQKDNGANANASQRMYEKLWLVDGGAGALGYDFARVLVEGTGLGDAVNGFLDLGVGFQ